MTRLLGFLIEGAALSQRLTFRVVVPDWTREEAEADLDDLKATKNLDFTIHSPSDFGIAAVGPFPADIIEEHEFVMRALATFANEHVTVDGWLAMFPFFTNVQHLKRPRAVIFPDAIPIAFPETDPALWGEGGSLTRWLRRTRETLAEADRVVTFSHHVARDQVEALFGVRPERIDVAPHAPPDLADLLPFVKGRTATSESRHIAAGMLRSHARERGWTYLQDFAFEDVSYVVVSTQDRVTKNIGRAAEAVRRLLRHDRIDVKLFTTASIHLGAEWTLLPGVIEREQMHRDVISLNELPREVHAALYHCAAAAIHPSFFEGGLGPFPFYEALSVGTPCLMARGPHVAELLCEEPDLASDTFDPYDVDGLRKLLRNLIVGDRDAVLARQSVVYRRLLATRTWEEVALEYAAAATLSETILETHIETRLGMP